MAQGDEGQNGAAPPAGGAQGSSKNWLLVFGGLLGVVVLVLGVLFLVEVSTAGDKVPQKECPIVAEGCNGKDVLTLETWLASSGFLESEPDASFDEATGAALYAFAACKDEEKPDREVTKGSPEWEALSTGRPPEAMGAIPCAPPGDVKVLQQRLAAAGYGDLDVDGLFGAHTEAALRLFEAQGDPDRTVVDGRIEPGGTEWDLLKDDVNEGNDAEVSAKTDVPCGPGPTGAVVVTYGCKGDAAAQLESDLAAAHFMDGGNNDVFGSDGFRALLDAQRCLDVEQDGSVTVDDADWKQIHALASGAQQVEC